MNHDMAATKTTARDRQISTTRTAIIDAFLDLAHSANAVSISMPAVAERAGVSVRTVYRHFPTKNDLQTDAALSYSRQAESAIGGDNDESLGTPTHFRAMWRDFADRVPAVIAEHTSPAGRDLRATRLPISRDTVRRMAPSIADDPEQVDLIIAVTSSSMFLELVDRMGHDPERAADLVLHLTRLIVNDANAKEDA